MGTRGSVQDTEDRGGRRMWGSTEDLLDTKRPNRLPARSEAAVSPGQGRERAAGWLALGKPVSLWGLWLLTVQKERVRLRTSEFPSSL